MPGRLDRLDITQTRGEEVVQPDSVLDNLARKTEARVRGWMNVVMPDKLPCRPDVRQSDDARERVERKGQFVAFKLSKQTMAERDALSGRPRKKAEAWNIAIGAFNQAIAPISEAVGRAQDDYTVSWRRPVPLPAASRGRSRDLRCKNLGNGRRATRGSSAMLDRAMGGQSR